MNHLNESAKIHEQSFREVITEGRHFPICDCGRRMDWLIIFQKGKEPMEVALCPMCNAPELMRVGPDGNVTNLKMQPDGAFGLV